MPKITKASDLYDLKTGDMFSYRGRVYTLHTQSVTIAKDYEVFKVWNSTHKVILLKVVR